MGAVSLLVFGCSASGPACPVDETYIPSSPKEVFIQPELAIVPTGAADPLAAEYAYRAAIPQCQEAVARQHFNRERAYLSCIARTGARQGFVAYRPMPNGERCRVEERL